MRCTRCRLYCYLEDSVVNSASPGCGCWCSWTARPSAAPPRPGRRSRPRSVAAACRGKCRRHPAPGQESRSAPTRRWRPARPPALTAFATRLPASILRAHGAGNSHDDPAREKLRAERGQRLEVVLDRDRGAGSLPRGPGERGVVIGGPTAVDDHQERHDEEGRNQGHFDHRLTTLALHCWACTCIVVEATT